VNDEVEAEMMWNGITVILLALMTVVPVMGGKLEREEKSMELIEVRKIWDGAPHNAFTDLIRFEGRWYCAFREGESHVSDDGRLRVIRSEDGQKWSSAALMEWEGGDVRDAKLSVTADGQLMLSGAVRFLQPVDGNRHQSVSWLSENGADWTGPHACPTGLGTWRWSTTWHGEYGYSFGYSGKDTALCLYRTADGKNWEVVKDQVFPKPSTYPNETSLVFMPDDIAYCLLRRDKGSCTAMLGEAQPPYQEWEWNDLGTRIGGPKMIRLEGGRFLAAVRLYDDLTRTSLCWVDPKGSTITEALKLPCGGDTSYAWMVQQGSVVWVSYYSSHEEKTSIYLAKVRIEMP
jgi:hypothetical protein